MSNYNSYGFKYLEYINVTKRKFLCLRLITIVRFIKMLYRRVERFHRELTIDERFHKPSFSFVRPPQQDFSTYESNLHFLKKLKQSVRN